MKKKLTITLLGMITGMLVLAQNESSSLRNNYPDSLILKTESNNTLFFLFNQMSRDKEYIDNELWDSMLSVMQTALGRSELEEAVKITYRSTGKGDHVKISIQSLSERVSTLTIEKDEIMEKLWNGLEFEIILPQVVVSFSISSIEELPEIMELDIESVWQEVQNKFTDEGKNNIYKGTGLLKYGKARIADIETNREGTDNLSITFLGVGLGYYRDRFVPDLGSKLSFVMHNRLGEEWMNFGVLYTRQFFFTPREESGFDLDQNGWVTGFWKIYAPEVGEFGLGIGGLIHRDGNFYEGATYKLSIFSKGPNARFTYSPEFIFTNDFKSIFPALRLGLAF